MLTLLESMMTMQGGKWMMTDTSPAAAAVRQLERETNN